MGGLYAAETAKKATLGVGIALGVVLLAVGTLLIIKARKLKKQEADQKPETY